MLEVLRLKLLEERAAAQPRSAAHRAAQRPAAGRPAGEVDEAAEAEREEAEDAEMALLHEIARSVHVRPQAGGGQADELAAAATETVAFGEQACSSLRDCQVGCEHACRHESVHRACATRCQGRCTPAQLGEAPGGGGGAAAADDDGCKRCLKDCGKDGLKDRAGKRAACEKGLKRRCKAECADSPAALCGTQCEAQGREGCRQKHGFPECEAKCGRHLCVAGKCTCPLMYAGDPFCATPTFWQDKVPTEREQCFVPFSDDRFRKKSGPNSTMLSPAARFSNVAEKIHTEVLKGTGGTRQTPPDLPQLADWSTCAVVGSSSALVGAGWGPEIDAHTAVIRFNDARVKGYEGDVGTRTTARVQNVMYCGYAEEASEICLHYTGWADNICPVANLRSGRCNFLTLSVRMLRYVRAFWPHSLKAEGPDRYQAEALKDTSAGFFGALLALHLCGQVDVYGFRNTNNHYYPKFTKNTKTPFEQRHNWDLERECIESFSSLPGINYFA